MYKNKELISLSKQETNREHPKLLLSLFYTLLNIYARYRRLLKWFASIPVKSGSDSDHQYQPFKKQRLLNLQTLFSLKS
jgi:hypothetical protein